MQMNAVMRTLAATCGTLALSACGGSGGMNSGLPPAPQSPAYTKMTDLTGTTTFQSASAGMLIGNSTIPASEVGQGVQIEYDSATHTYTVSDSSKSQTFGQGDRVSSTNPQIEFYRIPDPFQPGNNSALAINTPNPDGVDLSYVRWGAWTRPDGSFLRQDLLVFGSQTVASDMPRTGSASYSKIQIVGAAYTNTGIYELSKSTGSFDANFATGAISTRMVLNGSAFGPDGTFSGPQVTLNTVTGTGQIAAGTSAFTGTIGDTDLSGSFAGAFYGPRASEFGYVFEMRGANTMIIGQAAGAK